MPVSAGALYREVAVPLPPQARPAGRFRRAQRLTRPAEFDRVFAEGQRSVDRYLTILFRPNGLDYPRLGFAVSKRRVRRAVDRNRLRRRVRERFRLAAAGLPPVDLVVIARAEAGSCPSEELDASLRRHWDRITAAGRARHNGADRTDG